MQLEDDDIRRLKLFTLTNGYYLRESCSVLNRESCDSQVDKTELIWCKAQFGKDYTPEQIENLHQIKQFELDLSKGTNKEFIDSIIEQGSDAEPIWGTGCIDDPGDSLLRPSLRLNYVEKSIYKINERNDDPFDMIMILENRYGLMINSSGYIKVIDLCRLNSVDGTLCKESTVCTHIRKMFPPTQSSFSLSFVQRLTSFMGLKVIAFGNSLGDIVFYEESYLALEYPPILENSILHLKLDEGYARISTCDGIGLSSNLTVLFNAETLTIIYFDTSFENPIMKTYQFEDKLTYVDFLRPAEAGFFLVIKKDSGVRHVLHFSLENLQQGKFLCEAIDSLSEKGTKEQNNLHMVVSKDDFLSVPDFEFLTLSFNAPRNEHFIHKIYQNSLILESLPLYPSESNNLGFGACIAQIEVPVPNYSLIYENDDLLIDNPIHLRYTTYRKNRFHYEDIYANKKLLKSSQLDYEDCYVSRRAHGNGNSKVFKPESSTGICADNSVKPSNSEYLATLSLQLKAQYKRIDEIRHKMKGHSEFKIDSESFPYDRLDQLRAVHLHKSVFYESADIAIIQHLQCCNSSLKEALKMYIKDLSSYGEKKDPEHDSYVNAVIKKYLQIKDNSRFRNNGPKYDSIISDDNFVIEANDELSIRMYGTNPMILNAFTPSILCSNLNCVDLRSKKILICHIKELHCMVTATSSGLISLYRLTEWRGVYAFRFEKLLNVIKIQDVCLDSDDEGRTSFCETQRRFANHDQTFVNSCNKCRLVIENPDIHALNYTYHHDSLSASLYVSTPTKLVKYTIAASP